ncbi:MAG: acyl-CoA dehydrogenase family protein [Hyphomicrobiales bacterium]|nr:acyl-CoA dehydrogenase family protein [Hyphomicrobiales bacterium]
MDFSFSAAQEQVRETVIRFAQKEIAPRVREIEEAEKFPVDLFPKFAEVGLMGIRYPETDGGAGMDKVTDCIVREEMSRVCQSISAAWSAATHIGIWPIWRGGTADQKARWFAPALEGKMIAAFALSEPDGGSDTRALKTKAVKVDGGWRLSGSKLYITNAPFANMLLVAARTKPEMTSDAISLFMVDVPNPGVEITKLDKEGIKASETGLVHIADAFVPDMALLGGREGSYHLVMEALAENRIGVSANCLGMARNAYEVALDYARTRLVRGKPIIEYQAVAHRLADMATDVETMRWMVYHGAWRVDQGTCDMALASKIKLHCSETAVRVSENAIRVLGGAGLMREYPVGRIHRDALVYLMGEGTSEIQRNIIARTMKS